MDPNTANCDGDPANSCEANIKTDPATCGDCQTSYTALPGIATATCEAGVCKLGTCKAGFADCNSSVKDGCEVETASDPLNCGKCGQSCASGAPCVSGACAAPPEVVATGQSGPWLVVADTTKVFWINRDATGTNALSVMSSAKTAGTPSVVYKASAAPNGLALDDANVYFTVGETVQRVAKTGGTPTVVNTKSGGAPAEVAVDATQLYWIDAAANVVYHMPKAGGAPQMYTVWGSATLGSITLDATSIFLTDADQVSKAKKDGTGMTQVLVGGLGYPGLPTAEPTLVAVDATSAYYAGPDGISSVAITGGTANLLLDNPMLEVRSLAASGAYLYAAIGPAPDKIARLPVAGGNPATMATVAAGITKLTVDATHVYFTVGDGRVLRVPK
jgi:hypothetical protein